MNNENKTGSNGKSISPAPSSSQATKASSNSQGQKPRGRRTRRHLSCENCRVRKMRCSRTAQCASCRMRGEECIWVGAKPQALPQPSAAGGVPDAELEASETEVARLRKLVDLLMTQYEALEQGEGASTSAVYQHPPPTYGEKGSAEPIRRHVQYSQPYVPYYNPSPYQYSSHSSTTSSHSPYYRNSSTH